MTLEPMPEPGSAIAAIDRGHKALAEATTNFQRFRIHNEAMAIREAMGIVKRRDIQTAASLLVADAERTIAKATPPKSPPGVRYTGVTMSPPAERTQVSRFRSAHDHLSDAAFEAAKADATAKKEPVTRETFKRAARSERRAAAGERHAEAAKVEPKADVALHHCAVADLRMYVAPGSVDLIFTDPPYEPEALPAYIDLANFAAHALKPGGVVAVLTGNLFLPDVLRNLTGNPAIKYLWQMAYVMPGASTMVRPPRMHQHWKPLLVFCKGNYAGEWHNDVITVPTRREQENDDHKWQQQYEGIKLALSKWATPGQLVCDPFVGAGTTGVAAQALGCGFIGADIDADALATTRGRLL